MLLRIISDLHINFSGYFFDLKELDTDKETILIVAGDLCPGISGIPLLKLWSRRFKHIIYIIGNHEYYTQDIHKLKYKIREEIVKEELENVYFLDGNSIVLGNIKFLGCTLWTDFKNGNLDAMNVAKYNMSDFKWIYNKFPQLFTPKDSCNLHNAQEQFLARSLCTQNDKTIVVSHHAPSEHSIAPAYKTHRLNPAFSSDMDEFIKNNKIDLWIHGHMHDSLDYFIGDTRIICNPYGYFDFELNKEFKQDLLVEIQYNY